MPKKYVIHPGIGLARLGNHPKAFYLSRETPGGAHLELDNAGNETPIAKYRQDGQLKRQAARFRVFEYDVGADNQPLSAPVEVSPAGTRRIEWKVSLANRKGISRILDYRGQPSWDSDANPGATLRNPNITGADREKKLVISNEFPAISGNNQRATPSKLGSFLNETDIALGELQTDAQGRLIVLGGGGHCKGPGTPTRFADNNGWHDDVADGPVTATIKEDGKPDIEVEGAAWVIVAPPDFAPGNGGLLTMYERAYEAGVVNGVLTMPTKPSFRDHVAPLLRRAADLRWVANLGPEARAMTDDTLRGLAKRNADDPDAATRRGKAYEWFFKVADHISEFGQVPNVFVTLLDKWRDDDFVSDFDVAAPAQTGPAALDRASLEQAVGAGFYPGIEAGIRMTYPELYSRISPFRLIANGQTYTHRIEAENESVTRQLMPGHLTERMAVPWQADFLACRGDGSATSWWPSQRPDYYTTNVDAPKAELANKWYPGNTANWYSQEAWYLRLFIKPAKSTAGQPVQVADPADL